MGIVRPTVRGIHQAVTPPLTETLPWEDASGGTSATALLASLIASLGGWWWDGRTGIVIAGSGVSSWTDRVQGFVVSQGTDANRPTYANGIVSGGGGVKGLSSASLPLNGKTAYTMDVIGATAGWGGSVFVLFDGGAAAASRATGVLNGAAGHRARIEGPGGTINTWDSGDTAMGDGVYTFQADFGAGAAATTAVLRNGTTMNGSRTTAGAVSGTFATGNGFFLFTDVAGGSGVPLAAHGFVLVPTVSAAQNAQRIALERAVYGV